jgi:hypothetical protein
LTAKGILDNPDIVPMTGALPDVAFMQKVMTKVREIDPERLIMGISPGYDSESALRFEPDRYQTLFPSVSYMILSKTFPAFSFRDAEGVAISDGVIGIRGSTGTNDEVGETFSEGVPLGRIYGLGGVVDNIEGLISKESQAKLRYNLDKSNSSPTEVINETIKLIEEGDYTPRKHRIQLSIPSAEKIVQNNGDTLNPEQIEARIKDSLPGFDIDDHTYTKMLVNNNKKLPINANAIYLVGLHENFHPNADEQKAIKDIAKSIAESYNGKPEEKIVLLTPADRSDSFSTQVIRQVRNLNSDIGIIGISNSKDLYEASRNGSYDSITNLHDMVLFTDWGLNITKRNIQAIRLADAIITFGGDNEIYHEFAASYEEGRVVGRISGSGGWSDHMDLIVKSFADDNKFQYIDIKDPDPSELVNKVLGQISFDKRFKDGEENSSVDVYLHKRANGDLEPIFNTRRFRIRDEERGINWLKANDRRHAFSRYSRSDMLPVGQVLLGENREAATDLVLEAVRGTYQPVENRPGEVGVMLFPETQARDPTRIISAIEHISQSGPQIHYQHNPSMLRHVG